MRLLLTLLSVILYLAFHQTAKADLPQSFTVTVDKGDGELVELNLSKHSIRSNDFRIVTWSNAEGYVEVHTPANPAYPARTYRGFVTENPNHLLFAVVKENNTLKVEAHDGEGRIWSIADIDVTDELANGNETAPPVAPYTPDVGTTVTVGANRYFPPVNIYRVHGVEDITSRNFDSNNNSIVETLTSIEYLWNIDDYFNMRDAKLSKQMTEMIIRKDQFYFPQNNSATQFDRALRDEWLSQGQNTRGYIHSSFPYNFSFSGGYNTGNNHYQPGAEALAVNALYHEVAHSFRAKHYYYGKETMTGSHPSHSETNSQRVLYTRQVEIDKDLGIELLTSYPTKIHPRAAVDMTTTAVNTPVQISPMDNDYDANGDSLSIKSYTLNTAKGGTVSESNGVLTYTPATGYVGKDIIVYEVQDATGLYSKGLITIEVINGGLAAHWSMEESSGSDSPDLTGHGHTGSLDGTTFDSASITGPIGQALHLTASQRLIADNSNLILDPDRSYPLEEVTSNFFDPIDADFSATAWVKLDPSTTSALVFSKDNKAAFGYRLSLDTSKGLTARLRVWDGMIAETSVTGGTIMPDTWYHVAMVIDRTNHSLAIFLNGQQVGTTPVIADVPIFNGREDLQIGGTSSAFTGGDLSIDDARIYTKALDPTEIIDLHALGNIPAGEPNPIDGAFNLATTGQSLSWTAGQVRYQHDVYFGTDASLVAAATTDSPEYKGRQSAQSFNLDSLAHGVKYYWRVDEIDDQTVIPGSVWSFSTSASSMTENLVLYLSMDDDDVQTADGTAHTWDDTALPAQDFKAIGTLTKGTAGIVGQAVDLSATNDSLRSKETNPVKRPNSGGITISYWINTSSSLNSGQMVYDAGGVYLMRYYDGDLMPVFDGNSTGAQTFDVNINDSQWHHIVAQNDGAGVTTLYVDGNLVGTQSEVLMDTESLNRTMAIGSLYNKTNENLEAIIDEFAVWERQLTGEEITSIYDSGLAGNSLHDVPHLTNTSFESHQGFSGFTAGSKSPLGQIVANDGVTWSEVGDAYLWNRTDIPPDGVQVLSIGNGDTGLGQIDVAFPGTVHGVGVVSFDYASYSGSVNTTFRLLYNENKGAGWIEAWSTPVIGSNPDFSTKPWPTVEVPLNLTGDVDLRFETSGVLGAKFDNVKVTAFGPHENLPPVANDSTVNIDENNLTNTPLVEVPISDPNGNHTLGYVITSGNESGLFSIDALGYLRSSQPLDFENQSQYSLNISATDEEGLNASAVLTIQVNDINEAPIPTGFVSSLRENRPAGHEIGSVLHNDPDHGDLISFAITGGNDDFIFSIDAYGKITNRIRANFETCASYTLTITATDQGGLSAECYVSVDIEDIVEVGPQVRSSTELWYQFLGNQIWDNTYLNNWSVSNGGGATESLNGTHFVQDHTGSGAATAISGTSATIPGEAAAWSTLNENDWTWETRIKFHAVPNGYALWLGVGSHLIIVQIYADRTTTSEGHFSVDHNNADGNFHNFRIANDSNNDVYHVWRDGILISPVGGVPYDSTTNEGRMLLGDYTSRTFGNNFHVEIGYISYDPTGIYAPTALTNDVDQDQIDDSWESHYYSDNSNDPDSDTDGDGLTLYEEFLADTDPTDPASNLIFTSPEGQPDVLYADHTSPQRLYSLLYSSDMGKTDPWTPVPGYDKVPGTGAPVTLPLPNAENGFYKAEASLPQ